jgi:hypothetical protein
MNVNFVIDCIFWAVAYLLLKIVILYISIHYHYRSDKRRIEKSKNLINALSKLYETSVYLDPLYCDKFRDQDVIIRNAVAAGGSKRKGTLKFFQKIGGASHKVLSAFGTMLGSQGKSHWFKVDSSYATIEYALESHNSAAALAQRIWISLATEGKKALTLSDIAEAFGPDRKDEAEECFKAIDENENGDVRLTEMIPMLVDAGRTRADIYSGMQDIDHCINTFEWILLLWVALFMLFIILLSYVQFLQNLKDIFGFVGLGLSFTVGRIVNDFFQGANFIFFKHAYDIGDRIDLFNPQESLAVGVIVRKISLLYTVFERTDDGKEIQFSNERLALKRIENLTRSGLGKEKITIYVDVNTTFKDIEHMRDHLKAFLTHPDNNRDYRPDLAVRIKSLHELNKMELAIMFTHKSNWSNDALKGARSSRFYCALIEAIRATPINRPGPPPPKLGDEGKPQYMVVISDEEAAEKRATDALKTRQKRFDFSTEDEQLDAGAKKEAELAKEAKSMQSVAAIPVTLSGSKKERPPAKGIGQSTKIGDSSATEFDEASRGSRRRYQQIPNTNNRTETETGTSNRNAFSGSDNQPNVRRYASHTPLVPRGANGEYAYRGAGMR